MREPQFPVQLTDAFVRSDILSSQLLQDSALNSGSVNALREEDFGACCYSSLAITACKN